MMEDIVSRLPDVNHNPDLLFRPITGRYLAHAKHTHAEWGFIGADLVTGRRQLVHPTVVQAASLAHGVNRSAVHWALQRSNQRMAIEAGAISLVPPRPLKALPAPVSVEERLADIVSDVGLAAAYTALQALGMALGRTAA
jgi:hypothetical protein